MTGGGGAAYSGGAKPQRVTTTAPAPAWWAQLSEAGRGRQQLPGIRLCDYGPPPPRVRPPEIAAAAADADSRSGQQQQLQRRRQQRRPPLTAAAAAVAETAKAREGHIDSICGSGGSSESDDGGRERQRWRQGRLTTITARQQSQLTADAGDKSGGGRRVQNLQQQQWRLGWGVAFAASSRTGGGERRR